MIREWLVVTGTAPRGATKTADRLRPDTGDGMYAQESGCNTGSPVGGAHASTGNP